MTVPVPVALFAPAFAAPLLDLAAEADAGAEALRRQGVALSAAIEQTRWSSALAHLVLGDARGLAVRLSSAATRLADLADGIRALATQGCTL